MYYSSYNNTTRKPTSRSFGTTGGFGTSFSNFNLNAMMNMNEISSDVQSHLIRVYTMLATTILSAAGGAILDLYIPLGGVLTLMASIGLLMWLGFEDKNNVSKRIGILLAFGFLQGLNLGSLISVALYINPSVVVTALLGTTVIFACFSASAVVAKRREYLFLGGLLSSAVSAMMLMSFLNIFFRSTAMYAVQLYVGLMVFCGYVIFDTQMIIERASFGDKDYVMHGCNLFVDFVGIFVRILIILLRNQKRDDKRSSRSRN